MYTSRIPSNEPARTWICLSFEGLAVLDVPQRGATSTTDLSEHGPDAPLHESSHDIAFEEQAEAYRVRSERAAAKNACSLNPEHVPCLVHSCAQHSRLDSPYSGQEGHALCIDPSRSEIALSLNAAPPQSFCGGQRPCSVHADAPLHFWRASTQEESEAARGAVYSTRTLVIGIEHIPSEKTQPCLAPQREHVEALTYVLPDDEQQVWPALHVSSL